MADRLAAPPDFVATRQPVMPVLQGGLVTTAITLGGLYLLNHYDVDFNPMGMYADYVLPVGALLVGLAAGSGYGIMSWVYGVKIRRGLLLTVVLLQLLAYGAAEYVAYLDVMHRAASIFAAEGRTLTPPPFLGYFHYKTEHFAWKADHGDSMGAPLGHWGYFFVGLAALGFVAGGLIAPAVCMRLPYCEGCERYMRTKTLGHIPASLKPRKISKSDPDAQAARQAERKAAGDAAQAHADALRDLALANDGAGFAAVAAGAFAPKRATVRLPMRVRVDLIHCPSCARGWLRQNVYTGQGKQITITPLHKTEVGPAFTNAVLGGADVAPPESDPLAEA